MSNVLLLQHLWPYTAYIYMQTYSHEFSVPGHIPKSFLYLNLFLHNILLCFCLLLFLCIITGGGGRALLNISKLVDFCYMYLSYYCSQPVVMKSWMSIYVVCVCVCRLFCFSVFSK